MSIQKQYFGKMPDGRAVARYVMQNKNGIYYGLVMAQRQMSSKKQ